VVGGYRRSIAFFITLGACLVGLAVTLNVGWILLNWRTGLMLVLGVLFFALIITGVVLNTIFLVREVRRNEEQDRFINAVTHELKTPVASIRLYLDTLQTHQIDDAKRKEFYGVMLADCERLLGTIEQVLRAGRTRAPGSMLHRAPIDLAAMVRDCLAVARARHHLPPESLGYKESLEPELSATVFGDLEQLSAAVLNLVDNAIKYSEVQVRVMVEVAATDAKHVAVRVSDQGIGIPKQELKRIFNRFYRIPGAIGRRVHGTGLGLFIVQTIAKRHGGRVYAESAGPGLGSTVTLQLPIASSR